MTRSRIRRSLAWLAGISALLATLGFRWLLARPYRPVPFDSVVRTSTAPARASTVMPLPLAIDELRATDAGVPVPSLDAGNHAPRIDPAPPAVPARPLPNPKLDSRNVLFVGLDRHKGVKRGGSTDTLVIAAFDRSSDHIGLISVPRDLYVSVPDHGEHRINAVYGLARLDKKDPLEALERVLEDTLGLPIAHTIAVDLEFFERAIDTLGGVDVEVVCPIQDSFLDNRTESGRRKLDVAAGMAHLDGVTAAMFIRSRHGRSDWSRARRQQAVLLAVQRKLASLGGIRRLPSLFSDLESSLQTHMTRLELLALARAVIDGKPQHLHGVVLGRHEATPFRNERNWSVLRPNPEAIEKKIGQLFQAPKPGQPPRQATCPAADVALQRRFSKRDPAPTRPRGPSPTLDTKARNIFDPDHVRNHVELEPSPVEAEAAD